MKGVVKGIAYTLMAVVGVVALAVVLLVTLVDPNDYREDISRVAMDTAGIELKLGGDLSWRFYPVLGFGANQVGLALQSGQPELVNIGEMAVGIKILPLLSKKLEIDALDIGGLRANLVVDEKGNNNWQMAAQDNVPATPPAPAPVTTANPAEVGAETGALPDVFIPRIRIHDSSIQYEDKSAGVGYIVDLPLLELRDVNLKEPFSLMLEARVRDRAKLDVTTKIEGQVKALLAEQQFSIRDLSLAAQIGGIFAKPVAVNLQGNVLFDQAQDKADVKLERLQFANLVARLQLAATTVTADPAFKGHLESEVFDVKDLLEALGMVPPATQDADAMTRVQLNLDFAGTPAKVTVKPLALKLDQSTLSGEVSIVDVSKQAIRFDLQLDKLNADSYMAPAETAVASANEKAEPAAVPPATANAAAAELIPVELLRTLNVKGTFKAGEVTVQKIPLRDIGLSVKAINGDVQITDLGAKLLQGSLAGTVLMDATQAQPKITTKLDLKDIEMGDLMQPFVSAPLLSGRTSLKVDTTTAGNNMDVLIKQALGQIDLSMANTVVHGVNVNQIAVDAVKNKLGDFASLMPNYQEKLPKALKADTEIRNLLANMKVEKGHLLMPAFNADTGEGSLSANGDIDLINKGFDYQFGVVLSALNDNKYLKGVKWPVRCKGSLETSVSDWCRPDKKAVNGVLEQAATQAIRDQGAQKLGEKLGIDNADEAAVKEEMRQKAKAEEDRAKQKLEESLNKKLKKLF